MAVQSMRSGTYVHPGEQLTCQGCHERKHRPAAQRGRQPAGPAPRPVADHARRRTAPIRSTTCGWCSRCSTATASACHQEKKALDLAGAVEGSYGWTRSYNNLAGKYGFYFHVTNGSINTGVHGGSRTIARPVRRPRVAAAEVPRRRATTA